MITSSEMSLREKTDTSVPGSFSSKSLEKEIAILDVYLPEEMNKEDITKVVEDAINEVKPTSMKDMGLVMKKVNELLVGKNADMSLVSKLVKEKIMSN